MSGLGDSLAGLAKNLSDRFQGVVDLFKASPRAGADRAHFDSWAARFSWFMQKIYVWFRRWAVSIGCLFLVISGYLLTYQLFYIEMPLEQLATKISGESEKEDFRYDNVVYFHGRTLKAGQLVEFDVGTPRITRLGDPSVEFFVKALDLDESSAPTTSIGKLHISGLGRGSTVTHDLKNQELQRFSVPWTYRLGDRARITVKYDAVETPQGQSTPRIVFGTNVVDFSLWSYFFLFVAAGVGLLLFAPSSSQTEFSWDARRNAWRLTLLGFAVFAFYVQSGAFISHAFFPNHQKIGPLCINFAQLVNDGHLKAVFYRQTGAVIVPFLAAVVEGNYFRISKYFCDIYPTTGYIMYILWTAGLLYLMAVIREIWGAKLAVIFGVLSVLYFPFINDLYMPDVDAYFIILFAFYLGAAIRFIFDRGDPRINLGIIAFLSLLMGFIKVTPIFLVAVFSVLVLLKMWPESHRRALVWSAVAFVSLFSAFFAGKVIQDQFQHPNRHVGIEGEPFQRHVMWHMIWAASGRYDHYSAHDFTKSGGLRNKRVAERTGLPITTYLRQSETATQKVYKPDVLNALSERPGYFYATALHRFYEASLRFNRYTNRPPIWDKLIGKPAAGVLEKNTQLIRYGEGWKVAPLVLLAKFTQNDLSKAADTLFLVASIIGVFCFRSRPLQFFLCMAILAQLCFSFLVHDINRYFMFCSWAHLLGLSMFVLASSNAIFAAGRTLDP